MGNPTLDQKEAALMQMKINTRLTALQAAQTLMGTPGYTHVSVSHSPETLGQPGTLSTGGKVDHITLLAMAGDIEAYIIDDLADEANKAIDAAKKLLGNPPARILRP